MRLLALAGALLFLARAETPFPRFEDYPASADWKGPNAPVRFTTAAERMFRTRLVEAAKEMPDFAGHYRFAGWGCGSVCAAGAIIDLKTGMVYPPPLGGNGNGWNRWIFAGGFVDGGYVECRRDSRLMLVRRAAPDLEYQELHYLVWEDHRFRHIRKIVQRRSDASPPPR